MNALNTLSDGFPFWTESQFNQSRDCKPMCSSWCNMNFRNESAESSGDISRTPNLIFSRPRFASTCEQATRIALKNPSKLSDHFSS